MRLPDNIDGPIFSNGDWLTFSFDEAEFTMKIPSVPFEAEDVDRISEQRDFCTVDTSSWRVGFDGMRYKKIVEKSWLYEDRVTRDDVATCFLTVTISENKEADVASNLVLDFQKFYDDNNKIAVSSDFDTSDRAVPVSLEENDFLSRVIPQKDINWHVQHLYLQPGPYSCPLVLIPINRRFVVSAYFNFDSIHYPDRQNPYSDEVLHQMKLDLFDEFLSHIQVEYSGKTLETIRQLNPR